jgi:hypothetical protein
MPFNYIHACSNALDDVDAASNSSQALPPLLLLAPAGASPNGSMLPSPPTSPPPPPPPPPPLNIPWPFFGMGGGGAPLMAATTCARSSADQGLTLAHFRAQLKDLRDTSLTLELNFSTFGTHPRVDLGYVGDKVSSS